MRFFVMQAKVYSRFSLTKDVLNILLNHNKYHNFTVGGKPAFFFQNVERNNTNIGICSCANNNICTCGYEKSPLRHWIWVRSNIRQTIVHTSIVTHAPAAFVFKVSFHT